MIITAVCRRRELKFFLNVGIAELIPQSPPASGTGNVSEPMLLSQAGTVRKVVCASDHCVSAIRAVEVAVLVCLRSGCCHVTEVGGQ